MRRRAPALAVGAVALVAALGGGIASSRPPAVDIPAGAPVGAVVDRALPGSLLRLQPGTHGPVLLDRAITLEGAGGATILGPVEIGADGAGLRSLRVEGGGSGVAVRHAEGVEIDDVTIRGAELHGIEVSDGSVTVTGCVIRGLTSPFAQGFEIRNANGRPRTVVEGCSISSGQEGLVSHVSRVEFLNNVVSGTTVRAIAVTEMSEGLVEGNRVADVAGVALYCGDMSHCDMQGNVVRGVAPNPGLGKSHEGYGAVAWYYSRMRLAGNSFDVSAPRPVRLAIGSKLTRQLPMGIWPAGWRGAIPGVWVSAAALAALLAARTVVAPWLRRRRTPAPDSVRGNGSGRAPSRRVRDILLIGFVVQSFHMLEHGVQVFQVYVADAEVRSGLAGARVNTEWVHFLYNTAVLAFIAWAWWALRREPGFRWRASSGYLVAALAIQAYHQVEHTAKLIQHLGTGVDPAPGLIGHVADLVWFHYGINLAVYAGIAIALAPMVGAWLRDVLGRSERMDLRPGELHPRPAKDLLKVR